MNQVDPSEKHRSERATRLLFLTVVSSSCCSTHASVSTWTLVPSLPRFHLAVRELCSQVGWGLHAATVGFLFNSSPRTSSIVKGPLKVWPQSWRPVEKTTTLQTDKQQSPQELSVAQHIFGLHVTVCHHRFCPFVSLSSNDWSFILGPETTRV